MNKRLKRAAALGALAAVATAASAQAESTGSASLSVPAAQRPAPALASPLAPRGLAAQSGRRRAGLYLGGGLDRRFVQFVSLRLARGGRMGEARATLTVRCSRRVGTRLDNIRLAEIEFRAGRANASASLEEEVAPGVPEIGGLSRKGTITIDARVGRGGRATGTIRDRFTVRDPASGAVRTTCDSGPVRWSARMPARTAGRGEPHPRRGATYFGATAQRLPFLLQVLPQGRVVRPAGMAFRVGCPSAEGRPLDLTTRVAMPIDRRGRFGASGKFKRRFMSEELGEVTESYSWKLSGRFGSSGVAGTWRVRAVVRTGDRGRRTDTCATGRNRWRAVR